MKVLLIFTSTELNENYEDVSIRDESIGKIPPLSLLSVASIFEQEGVEVQILDMDAEEYTFSQALEKVKTFDPDLLGFSLSTFSFHPILTWIKKFKQVTDLPILVGGAHVNLYAEETLSHPEIDYVIVGEADVPLPQFIRAFYSGKSFKGIKSLCYRDEKGNPVIDVAKQSIPDIDKSPWAARHLIRNELYTNILTRRKNFTAMLFTRGCPYRCTFCDQKFPKFRMRTPRNFVDEIKYNYFQHDIREFDIYDSTFTAVKSRAIEVCDLIREEKLDISFTIRTRVDSVNNELLDALKKAGCHTIMYGIESSNRELLKRMKKDISIEKIRETIEYTYKIGIETLGYFVFGTIGETEQSIKDTIQFSVDLPLNYAQYTVLVPTPNTEIYDYYMANGLGDYWSRYTRSPESCGKIELLGTQVTRAQASYYTSIAYMRFYFRPRIIWERLIKVRDWQKLVRLARGAWNISKKYVFGQLKPVKAYKPIEAISLSAKPVGQ